MTRCVSILALVATLGGYVAAQQPQPAPAMSLEQVLPVDPAVRTGQLPNGLRYYIRRNTRPANRVSMRLAVNVGSIHEENDQRIRQSTFTGRPCGDDDFVTIIALQVNRDLRKKKPGPKPKPAEGGEARLWTDGSGAN